LLVGTNILIASPSDRINYARFAHIISTCFQSANAGQHVKFMLPTIYAQFICAAKSENRGKMLQKFVATAAVAICCCRCGRLPLKAFKIYVHKRVAVVSSRRLLVLF